MNKAEAKSAIENGQKVTHDFFSKEEFVTRYENTAYYIFEDGVKQRFNEFWEMRTSEGWNDGWSIYNENKQS